MKNISKEEFKDYLEYKEFMNEKVGAAGRFDQSDVMNLDELDQIAAARGEQDFTAFLNEMKRRQERDDK